MLSCLNPAACLGALEDGFEAEGSCHASYQGRLCSECEDGFVRNWKFECSRCPSLAQNLGVSVALGLFGVTVLTLLVRLTLASVDSERSQTSAFIKIMLGHVQLLALLLTFEMQWPAPVQALLQS